jgi:RNA polymerase sigma factor (sigma-70 family)
VTTVLEPEVESDPYLISLVRGGDAGAFGQLYQRHVSAARRLARVLAGDPSDADDLVAETFTKVFSALRSGHGPDTAFRAYLLTALRHTFYDRAKQARRVEYTDDLTAYERPVTGDDPAVRTLERAYAARAFARLPERWRAVLWHTEVEGESPAEVAPLLGLTPNGVAALAYRARERLRQNYLQEHIALTESPRCHWTGEHLAGYVRAGLARRDRSKVEDHLAECPDCRVLHRELTEENSGLRGVIAGVLLGVAGPGYLADSVKPAGGLVAGISAFFLAGWQRFAEGASEVAAAAGLAWHFLRFLPKRLVERFGFSNVAAAGGLVAAGLAGVLTFAIVLVQAEPPPTPNALPLPAPAQPKPAQPPAEVPPPAVTPTETPAPPEPVLDDPVFAAPPADAPVNASMTKPTAMIASSEPGAVRLEATQTGTLPVTVRFAESTADADSLHLGVRLPSGMSLHGPDAGDGWNCRAPGVTEVVCDHSGPVRGGATTARIPVAVAAGLTGYQRVDVQVLNNGVKSAKQLRFPIAPAGLRLAYATVGRAGFALGGNVLLACQPRPGCLNQDNNVQLMLPTLPESREPSAPAGLAKAPGLPVAKAASGARIDIPKSAKVTWAGLAVTSSDKALPAQVAVHGPDGGWQPVRLGSMRASAGDRPVTQAFADVTDLVAKAGGGDWWLTSGAADLPSGLAQFAGWSLTVAYADESLPHAELAIYAGPKPLKESEELNLALGQGGKTDLGVVLWDGDQERAGDSLYLDKLPAGIAGNVARGVNTSALICAVSPQPCTWRSPGLDVLRHQGKSTPGSLAQLQAGSDPIEVGLLAVLTSTPD